MVPRVSGRTLRRLRHPFGTSARHDVLLRWENGLFPGDRFAIDLEADAVTRPAKATVRIGRVKDRTGVAKFSKHCATCPLGAQCNDVGPQATGPRRGERGRARASRADRFKVACRLPADTPEGREKARPPDETPTRRLTREGARKTPRRSRLQPPVRSSQPHAPRDARGPLDRGRNMGRGPVRGSGRTPVRRDRPRGPAFCYELASFAPSRTLPPGARKVHSVCTGESAQLEHSFHSH